MGGADGAVFVSIRRESPAPPIKHSQTRSRRGGGLSVGAAAVALVGLIVVSSGDRRFAAGFCAAAVGALVGIGGPVLPPIQDFIGLAQAGR